MAQLSRVDAIQASDLEEYLQGDSDFAFELRCLRLVRGIPWLDSQHSGSYTDPVTGKMRQFDIRARFCGPKLTRSLRLAIECKNLRPYFPLLVHCVPRTITESQHCVVRSHGSPINADGYNAAAFEQYFEVVHVVAGTSSYRPGEHVGKACVQVGRSNDKSISATDSEVFEKWSQALASCRDLVGEAARDGRHRPDWECDGLILPIVVVPNGMLWIVNFDESGSQVSGPIQTDRCPYFVDQPNWIQDGLEQKRVSLSHLEFVTEAGLLTLIQECNDDWRRWYPAQ